MSTLDLAALRALPKVELHLHLEGAIPPPLALRLAAARGVKLPGADRGEAGLREAYRFTNFGDFIALYKAVSSCLVLAQDFCDAGLGVGAELQAQGVRYAELTFTPMTHVVRGVDPDAMLQGLLQAQQGVEATEGVQLAWVFDVVRCFPDQAPMTVDLMLRARKLGLRVVGIGVGGPEAPQWPAEPLAPSFARAKANGFSSLPHAGEQDGAASVRAAIEVLGADRIGHGVRCLEDPQLVVELRERGIPLEVCPSSNVALHVVASLAEHPLPKLLAAGLKVSLNTDDPPMFGTTLCEEYLRCAEAFAWDANEVVAIASAAVEHSHLQAAQSRELVKAQQAWLRALPRNP